MRTFVGAAAAVLLWIGVPAALAHDGNPNMRSQVTAVTPATKGVTVSVLNYDDRLELHNTSGKPVVIEDYRAKPYARVLADGTVQVNTNSEAFYLNDDRYGQVQVPEDLGAEPKWKLVSRNGRFEWHDHRMHWMSRSDPPQVTDAGARTHIFDWKVPVTIDGTPGAIAGTLDWVPLPGGSLPMWLILISAFVLIALSLGVFLLRRRRADADGGEPAEAW
ncbi:MAG: hypothetical protein ACRDK0_07035 [Solirubrobacteraceae bacterium]